MNDAVPEESTLPVHLTLAQSGELYWLLFRALQENGAITPSGEWTRDPVTPHTRGLAQLLTQIDAVNKELMGAPGETV